MAVETDDLRQHRGREDRHAAGLFLEDDLQQDAAREVLAGLGVADLEVEALQHHRLDLGEGDVARYLGVVEPPVRILLEHARPGTSGGGLLRRTGATGRGHRESWSGNAKIL